MHIAVDLGVQKVASFQADTLLPQEIDHELNMAMDRFVKQRYNPLSNRYRRGFEQSQKRIDDLRTLVEDVTIEQSSTLGTVYDSELGRINADRFVFPLDYQFLLNVKCKVRYDCDVKLSYQLRNRDSQYIKVPLDQVPGYNVQKIERWDDDSSTYKVVIQAPVLADGLTTQQLFDQSLYYDGVFPSVSFDDGPRNIKVSSTTADSPIADGSEFYLRADRDSTEDYNTFESDPNTGTILRITYIAPNSETTVRTITTGLSSVTQTRRTSSVGETRITACKFVTQDEIHTLLDDPFNTTKYDGPLYTIQENSVDIYCNDHFITEDTIIRYLRRPQRMNKTLLVGCELPDHTHAEIVEMAVKSILEGFESPRYQTQTGEVLESE